MALSATSICNFGWKARDFKLKGVDGKLYTLDHVRGTKGTLVVFICNHCPYVRAVIRRLVEEQTPSKRSASARSRSCRTTRNRIRRIPSRT